MNEPANTKNQTGDLSLPHNRKAEHLAQNITAKISSAFPLMEESCEEKANQGDLKRRKNRDVAVFFSMKLRSDARGANKSDDDELVSQFQDFLSMKCRFYEMKNEV